MKIIVRDGDIEKALRVMKRKLQQEGIIREQRRCQAYEKPSAKRRREKNEQVRRKQRDARKAAASRLY